jgi:type II secretory pathway component HofQ
MRYHARNIAIDVVAIACIAASGIAAWHVAHEKTITIEMRNADVRQILRSVADQEGAALSLSPAVRCNLTIETKGSPLDGLMDSVCTACSCRWTLTQGQPRVLIVTPLLGAGRKP